MTTATLEWRSARYTAFRWRYELSTTKKIALAFGIACLTGILAQVRIMLPFTPVPITGQTFAVLLAGVLLGKWWGGISQSIYAILGIAGVPWFQGWGGGISHIAGPTGGYIIGFILCAFAVGYFTDQFIKARKFHTLLAIMLAANFILVYVPGLLQLGLWLNLVSGKATTVAGVFKLGFAPFIVGDIVKCAAAAAIGWSLVPKQSYAKESDRLA